MRQLSSASDSSAAPALPHITRPTSRDVGREARARLCLATPADHNRTGARVAAENIWI